MTTIKISICQPRVARVGTDTSTIYAEVWTTKNADGSLLRTLVHAEHKNVATHKIIVTHPAIMAGSWDEIRQDCIRIADRKIHA